MRSSNCTGTIETSSPPVSAALARLDRGLSSSSDVLRVVWRTLIRWQRRHDYRLALATMEDRMLDDIGLTREQAAAEARKPFWHA